MSGFVVAVRDSGDVNQLRHGSDTVAVHVLAYDIAIIACLGAQTASIASVTDRRFELPEGYTEQSDAGSAHDVGMQEMDRHASAFIEGTIAAALGL